MSQGTAPTSHMHNPSMQAHSNAVASLEHSGQASLKRYVPRTPYGQEEQITMWAL